MFLATTKTSLLKLTPSTVTNSATASRYIRQTIKFAQSSSTSGPFIKTEPKKQADAASELPPPIDDSTTTVKETSSGGMMNRFVITAEVTVSKIFPAGFGWQSASVVADGMGMEADTLNFALTTGAGDAIGVLAGHLGYYAAKKSMIDASINLTRELHTGILLSSAAFCSGTAWQPIVNALQGAELPFSGVFWGTWVGCGSAFYLGLRGARTILSGYFEHIHGPTYENSKTDMSLSTAIGGATGFFVGTDAAYLPSQNFLIDVVGIQDGTPDLVGAAVAGSSTALGFAVAQTGLNGIFPSGKCWND